jgi:CHRD domain-containing protein
MKTSKLLLVLGIGAIGFNATAIANDDRPEFLRATLRARNEVPVVISNARGEFRAKINWDAQTIEYELSYSGLEGPVTQSHIHIGQPFAAGGISIWFYSNNPPITTAPAGTQACPDSPATITAGDVIGPTAQAVPVGSFFDAVRAIRTGNAYANVHSTSAPGGEIRGQIEIE